MSVLGVPPFVVENYRSQAKKFTREQLMGWWGDFRQADIELKLNPGKKEWVLENLLVKLRSEGIQATMQA